MEIEQKKQIILNLNQHLNQKSNALEGKLVMRESLRNTRSEMDKPSTSL
jgi:hypothetical protein